MPKLAGRLSRTFLHRSSNLRPHIIRDMSKNEAGPQPSLVAHFRDIVLLPFNVTVSVPWLISDSKQAAVVYGLFMKIAGTAFFMCGLFLFSWSVYLFKDLGRGTLAPWTPTQKLIVAGPYKYCRNPMITGVFFILLAEALILFSVNILIWAGIFFIINTVYFIIQEEPDLYERFGNEYLHYKKHVPRWLPNLRPYQKN